jgi:hypothetical protein
VPDANFGWSAMSLYVWHIPPLLAMHLVFDYLGYPRFDPSSPGFIVLSIVQLQIMGVLVAPVFVTLRPRWSPPAGWPPTLSASAPRACRPG